MPLSHRRQKRLAAHMKSRFEEKLRERSAKSDLLYNALRNAPTILRAALDLPIGPSFTSELWSGTSDVEGEAGVPSLVMVVVTRVTLWGSLIPAFALVDRTCLGVKSASLGSPRTRAELEKDLAALAEIHGPIGECPFELAQSVVFHAIDYARTLGFEPHEDFPASVFGSRPEELMDTPFSLPLHPIYIVGPGDPVESVLETLDRAVGPFNYSFMSFEPLSARGDIPADEDDEAPAAVG